jgi:sortase A
MFDEKERYHVLKSAQYVFAMIGIVALGYWAIVTVHAHLFQAQEAQRMKQELRAPATQEKPNSPQPPSQEPEPTPPAEGATIANLAIPRIGLSTVVIEGVGEADLKVAPGHIPGTALPGESGNIGIAGHRDTFFRPVRLIHIGDLIVLTSQHGEDQYRVVSTKIVDPHDVEVLYPTGHDVLTLVTCYPFYYVGSAPKRFIVQADRFKEGDETTPAV